MPSPLARASAKLDALKTNLLQSCLLLPKPNMAPITSQSLNPRSSHSSGSFHTNNPNTTPGDKTDKIQPYGPAKQTAKGTVKPGQAPRGPESPWKHFKVQGFVNPYDVIADGEENDLASEPPPQKPEGPYMYKKEDIPDISTKPSKRRTKHTKPLQAPTKKKWETLPRTELRYTLPDVHGIVSESEDTMAADDWPAPFEAYVPPMREIPEHSVTLWSRDKVLREQATLGVNENSFYQRAKSTDWRLCLTNMNSKSANKKTKLNHGIFRIRQKGEDRLIDPSKAEITVSKSGKPNGIREKIPEEASEMVKKPQTYMKGVPLFEPIPYTALAWEKASEEEKSDPGWLYAFGFRAYQANLVASHKIRDTTWQNEKILETYEHDKLLLIESNKEKQTLYEKIASLEARLDTKDKEIDTLRRTQEAVRRQEPNVKKKLSQNVHHVQTLLKKLDQEGKIPSEDAKLVMQQIQEQINASNPIEDQFATFKTDLARAQAQVSRELNQVIRSAELEVDTIFKREAALGADSRVREIAYRAGCIAGRQLGRDGKHRDLARQVAGEVHRDCTTIFNEALDELCSQITSLNREECEFYANLKATLSTINTLGLADRVIPEPKRSVLKIAETIGAVAREFRLRNDLDLEDVFPQWKEAGTPFSLRHPDKAKPPNSRMHPDSFLGRAQQVMFDEIPYTGPPIPPPTPEVPWVHIELPVDYYAIDSIKGKSRANIGLAPATKPKPKPPIQYHSNPAPFELPPIFSSQPQAGPSRPPSNSPHWSGPFRPFGFRPVTVEDET